MAVNLNIKDVEMYREILEDELKEAKEGLGLYMSSGGYVAELSKKLKQLKTNTMTKIFRNFNQPDREDITWKETWSLEDSGLIKNYEVGRVLAIKQPELSEKALRGEFPALEYMRGTDEDLKLKKRTVALNYLAQWQALIFLGGQNS